MTELINYCKHVYEKEELEELNKQVAECFGCWHELVKDHIGILCTCGNRYSICDCSNPNYILDPVSLLRELRKREDWFFFATRALEMEDIIANWAVPQKYIFDQTGLLLLKVLEFPAFKTWRGRNDTRRCEAVVDFPDDTIAPVCREEKEKL